VTGHALSRGSQQLFEDCVHEWLSGNVEVRSYRIDPSLSLISKTPGCNKANQDFDGAGLGKPSDLMEESSRCDKMAQADDSARNVTIRIRTATKSAAGDATIIIMNVSPPGYRSLEPSTALGRSTFSSRTSSRVQTTAPDAVVSPCRLACRGHFWVAANGRMMR